jgi:hypothetical protein
MRVAALLAGILMAGGCAGYQKHARKRMPETTRLLPIAHRRPKPATTSDITNGSVPDATLAPIPAIVDAVARPAAEFGSWQSVSRMQTLRPLQLSDGRFRQHPVIEPAAVAQPAELEVPDVHTDGHVANATDRVELLPPPPTVDAQISPREIGSQIKQASQTGLEQSLIQNAVHEQATSQSINSVHRALFERVGLRWNSVQQQQTSQSIPTDGYEMQPHWRGVDVRAPVRKTAPGTE